MSSIFSMQPQRYVSTHLHICVYMYIHIHTYIHIYTQQFKKKNQTFSPSCSDQVFECCLGIRLNTRPHCTCYTGYGVHAFLYLSPFCIRREMEEIFYSFPIRQKSQVQTGFQKKRLFFGIVNPKDIKISEILSRSAMKSEKPLPQPLPVCCRKGPLDFAYRTLYPPFPLLCPSGFENYCRYMTSY